jgi:Ca2+-binding EF-hand superfamily protein
MRRLWIVALCAAPAAADGVDNIFAVWDANRDGILTPDEIPDEAIFGKVDADGDGKITRAEVAAFLGLKPEPPKPDAPKPGKGEPLKKPEEKKSEAAPAVEPRTLKERIDDFFRRYDADKDGKVRKDEFKGASDEQWQEYDRTRDGALNRREAARFVEDQLEAAKRNPRPDNFMELFDLDRDKRVTKREYDGPGQFFRQYDRDNDKVVTEAELAMGPDMGPVRPEDEMAMEGPTVLPKQGLLDRYDANKDGRLTPDEFKADNVFRRLDKNSDGTLSGSELR